jgi:hypothetical protein
VLGSAAFQPFLSRLHTSRRRFSASAFRQFRSKSFWKMRDGMDRHVAREKKGKLLLGPQTKRNESG